MLPPADPERRLGGQDAAAHRLFGNVLRSLGKTEEAIKAWGTSASFDPSEAAVYYQIAQPWMALGHEKGSRRGPGATLARFKRVTAAYGY